MVCSNVGVVAPEKAGGRGFAYRKRKVPLGWNSLLYPACIPSFAISGKNPPNVGKRGLLVADRRPCGNLVALDNFLPSLPQPERGLSVEAINLNSGNCCDKTNSYHEEDLCHKFHRRKDFCHKEFSRLYLIQHQPPITCFLS